MGKLHYELYEFEQLPFVGTSYEFVGETQGAPFSAYIVNAKPGQSPPLHTHPYVEIAFTLEGRAAITVGDETHEVNAGGMSSFPRTHRIDSLTLATRRCAKSISTPARDLYKRISPEGEAQVLLAKNDKQAPLLSRGEVRYSRSSQHGK